MSAWIAQAVLFAKKGDIEDRAVEGIKMNLILKISKRDTTERFSEASSRITESEVKKRGLC